MMKAGITDTMKRAEKYGGFTPAEKAKYEKEMKLLDLKIAKEGKPDSIKPGDLMKERNDFATKYATVETPEGSKGVDDARLKQGLKMFDEMYGLTKPESGKPTDGLRSSHGEKGSTQLDKATAADFLKRAQGDKELARKMAREAGYVF